MLDIFYVQAREPKPDSAWVAHARESDYELADMMARLIEEGMGERYPAGVAVGRVARADADLSPEEVGAADRTLAAPTQEDADYRAALKDEARRRLGR